MGETTLPVEIYSAMSQGLYPEINAISTIIIVVSMDELIGVTADRVGEPIIGRVNVSRYPSSYGGVTCTG